MSTGKAQPTLPVSYWGLAGEFLDVDSFLVAVASLRRAGYTFFDAHTPIPVHGLDEAMEIRPSRLPRLVFFGGLVGCLGGLLLQWWSNGLAYPFRISGKPLFAFPPAIPVTFEMTVLFSAIGAVLGLFVANGQPEFSQPLFTLSSFHRASDDRFFVVIEVRDPIFDEVKTKELLISFGASAVHWVESS